MIDFIFQIIEETNFIFMNHEENKINLFKETQK